MKLVGEAYMSDRWWRKTHIDTGCSSQCMFWLYVGKECMVGNRTYSPPMRRSPESATLWRVEVCNFPTIGNGASRMAKSVKIQGIETIIFKRYWLPQRRGASGFHEDSTGAHMKATAKEIAMYHPATTAMRIRAVIWNALVMKMRWSSSKIDNLDEASRQGCKSATE